MEQEIWKDIPGYEGLYQASTLGRIRSLDKYLNGSNQFGVTFKTLRRGKILKPRPKRNYLSVHLSKNNNIKDYFIHRLVAITFIPNYKNLKQINHIDENKYNNKVSNLEWCSPKQNCNHGTRNYRIKSNLSMSINQYSLNGIFIKRWNGIREASRQCNICDSGIVKCCKGIYKTCGGYIWRYAD